MVENYKQYFKSVEERYDVDPYPRRDPEKEREIVKKELTIEQKSQLRRL